jgi:hypothetical protein
MVKFDLRAAERARERMQGTEMGGRPVCIISHPTIALFHGSQIDVHYSLPRDDRGGEDKSSVSLASGVIPFLIFPRNSRGRSLCSS